VFLILTKFGTCNLCAQYVKKLEQIFGILRF